MNERHAPPAPESETDIRYVSPAEQSPEDMPQHKFELTQNGQVIGGAEVDYFSTPFPLYQLTDLWVDPDYAGKGNAGRILDRVEEFLQARRKPGVLADAIIDGSPAQGMYARRGWQEVPQGHGLHVFNWPSDVSLSILQGYGARRTPAQDEADLPKLPNA